MNITNNIKNAISLGVNWRHYDFYYVIEELANFFNVDYEPETEKIAMIKNDNDIVGYVDSNYPLFFLEDNNLYQIKIILNKYKYIQYINVDSFNDECLSVDEALYNKYFDYMDNIDNFSVKDFYFYNITK